MTDQEIFNTVAKHLLTQNRKAQVVPECDPEDDNYKVDPKCCYRTPDGLKCAVGCLIPDEKYTPEIEGAVVWVEACYKRPYLSEKAKLNDSRMEIIQGILREQGIENFQLLKELQEVHDTWEVPDWSRNLRDIATDYNLSAEVLDQFAGAPL